MRHMTSMKGCNAAAVLAAVLVHGCVGSGCPPGFEPSGDTCHPEADASDSGVGRGLRRLIGARSDLDAGSDEDAGTSPPAVDAALEPTRRDAGRCLGFAPFDCYVDDDADGHAELAAVPKTFCGGCPAGWTATAPTQGQHDCRPADPEVHSDAPELCNGINDDCDAVLDEETSSTCIYAHAEGACVAATWISST